MKTFSFETVIHAKDLTGAQKMHDRLKDVYLKTPKLFDDTGVERVEYHEIKEVDRGR
jgi:hypothetical protein